MLQILQKRLNDLALVMFLKSAFSVLVSVLLSLLHVACCILPLFSAIAGTVTHHTYFSQYKTIFTVLQVVMFLYVVVRLVLHYRGRTFHNRMERIAYHISFFVVGAGLLIEYFEPFQSENQKIAKQQFEFFRTHRRLEMYIQASSDTLRLKEELLKIRGVKPDRILFHNASVALTFNTNKTSRTEILNRLKARGYDISLKE